MYIAVDARESFFAFMNSKNFLYKFEEKILFLKLSQKCAKFKIFPESAPKFRCFLAKLENFNIPIYVKFKQKFGIFRSKIFKQINAKISKFSKLFGQILEKFQIFVSFCHFFGQFEKNKIGIKLS